VLSLFFILIIQDSLTQFLFDHLHSLYRNLLFLDYYSIKWFSLILLFISAME